MKPLQAMPFPTDNRLRDDVGLPPLAALPPPPPRLTPRPPAYFPADARLRDDIGLPPLGDGVDAEGARRSPSRPLMQRLARAGAAVIRVIDGGAAAVRAILQSRRRARVARRSTLRPI